MKRIMLVLFTLLLPALAGSAAFAADKEIDFNRDIRPLLSKNCFACHGQDEKHREADLRLDVRDAAIAAADSGEIPIIPGKSADSELLKRITTDDADLRMPPADSGKTLSADEVALIRRWIDSGAKYAEHWSFVKPQRVELPKVTDAAWPANGIDHFIAAELEKHGLAPSPRADRYSLIRRLSLDLRGLPPTPNEVQAFIADESPLAYEKLVDHFLEDKSYGERWARVWLDLARFADSRGYGSDPLRTNMWRYRDWVIDAFNNNQPYDQFTIDQLAGDLLPDATIDQKIATAFHRNTMTNTEGGTDDEEFRVAAVKDRIETTLQVWMGLTLKCANCHDHKYDPISQRDYYRMYAFFNQTADADRPDEAPVMQAPTADHAQQLARIDEQIAAKQTAIDALKPQLAEEQKAASVSPTAGRFLRVELPGAGKMLSLAEVQVFSGGENVATKGKATQSSTDYDGPANLANDGNTNGDFFQAKSTTHTKKENNPWWEVDLSEAKQIEKVVVWNRTDGNVYTRLANFRLLLLDADRKTVWSQDIAAAPNPKGEFAPAPLGPIAKQIAGLNEEIAKLNKSRPKMPTLPIMQELAADKQRESFVMVKGNFLVTTDKVDAGVPSNFHPLSENAPTNRLGVAQWLVDPNNPLTSRVAVNRFWAAIFGRGLVETEEDFGTQGEPPSHPELLDWLATEFVDMNWNMKQLVKMIVMSSTYQQTSRLTPELIELDPRNRLLSRGPRFRLEAETIRDQALAISGLLTRQLYGPSVYPYQPAGLWRAAFNGERKWPTSTGEDKYRRGLYTFIRRTTPYPSMATFDAPSREACTVRRIRTNTPLQAFVTLNDPVFVECAQAFARRIMQEGGESVEDRAKYALALCLVRPAQPQQVEFVTALFNSELEFFQANASDAKQMATDPLGALPDGVATSEAAAWTVVANVLLNLDGVLTKN